MALTNRYNLPFSLSVWLAHDTYNKSDDPSVISATSLLKPIKCVLLSRQIQATETDVSDLIPSSMGTAIHANIEQAWTSPDLKETLLNLGQPNKLVNNLLVNPEAHELYDGCIPVYLEQRRNKQILDWTITGQFDIVINGRLEDFKSTGTYNWINQSNVTKYVQQASIYRWLFPDLITDEFFCINYIFTDWSSIKARQDNSYPQRRIIQQTFMLMSLADTESFIRTKLTNLSRYSHVSQEHIPSCTAEELWLKPSVFKYYRNPSNKTRSTKNFDSYWEANKLYTEDGSIGEIVEVKGEVGFCKYCNAAPICNQAEQFIQEGRLFL